MEYFVVTEKDHNELVAAAYRKRGYDEDESKDAARFCGASIASWDQDA